jgi:threonine synthase
MQSTKAAEQPQMKIRLSSELKALINAAASSSNRTLNAEITTRLEATFKADYDCNGGALNTLKAVIAEEPPKTLKGTWQNFKDKLALGVRHAETLNVWKDAAKIVGYTPPPAAAEGVKAMIFAEKVEPQHVIMLLQAMKDVEEIHKGIGGDAGAKSGEGGL